MRKTRRKSPEGPLKCHGIRPRGNRRSLQSGDGRRTPKTRNSQRLPGFNRLEAGQIASPSALEYGGTPMLRYLCVAAVIGAFLVAAQATNADDVKEKTKTKAKTKDPAKLFQKIDTNNDGKLSKEEVANFF